MRRPRCIVLNAFLNDFRSHLFQGRSRVLTDLFPPRENLGQQLVAELGALKAVFEDTYKVNHAIGFLSEKMGDTVNIELPLTRVASSNWNRIGGVWSPLGIEGTSYALDEIEPGH
ncbi:protein of unknown function (plasmid) [Cupriavidus taiwanensis]|uniref:Uncharacterized protein n=1 Tax=Cupriavidus taiwanensis TaxID=164546 RepID=A0A7Z7JFZ8_9BURK|nr:hypothetical protein CBM2597_U30095 [Cupriavidus taiwanensis]SOZ97058.1 hypothetical protein CBM2598_U30101 [Cupriavidus taiwanensis]SPC25884.1 hypothetical protein CBM2594_U20071 [Cupriavidus taiwanensis]SPD38091.1 protein of unknown function [Cupriavidus taiwanensis]